MTAADRMALRYVWYFASSRGSVTRLVNEFGIVPSTLRCATRGVGLVKPKDVLDGDAPGEWFHKLIALYDAERKPSDDADASAVYLRAAKRGKEIIQKIQTEQKANEVVH
jgi:hypothetical protein